MPQLTRAQVRALVRADAATLLHQRMRAGLWLLLAAIVFWSFEAVRNGDVRGALVTIKGVQLATVAAVALLLRLRPRWHGLVTLAIVTVGEVCATSAATGIVLHEVTATLVVLGVLTTATAALLPWGPWAQLAAAACAVGSAGANVALVAGSPAPTTTAVAAFVVAILTSLYLAYEHERHRIAERLAEELARTSEARKAAMFETALDAVVTMDHEGRVVEFNPAAEQIFGHRAADVVGRPLAEVLVPPALRGRHREGLSRHLATGAETVIGRRLETTALRADGAELPVELAITRVPGEDPPVFTGYLRDLTERRLAREARTSAALVRAGHEMMALLDSGLILDRLCTLAATVLGANRTHVLLWRPERAAFVAVASHGDTPAARAALDGVALNRAEITPLLVRLQRGDAVEVTPDRNVELSPAALAPAAKGGASLYAPLRRDDEIVGMLMVAFDGSPAGLAPEQHAVAHGLAQIASMALTNAHLVEQLAEASRIKSEFLSTMSHELRTPLNAILGYAEMLDDTEADAAQRSDLLVRLHGKGRLLLGLVEQTLAIGSIESGHGTVACERVLLRDVWRRLAVACGALTRAESIALEWDAAVPDVALVTDASKLETVVRNLVDNACKFTERGHVRVTARLVGAAVHVAVSDTGIGIDPAHRELIFEMFRQADGSESRRFGGTGLGLYVVRRFLEQIGARIEVESTPGRGSTFTIVHPLDRSDDSRMAL